jgi:HEAT repeat protein
MIAILSSCARSLKPTNTTQSPTHLKAPSFADTNIEVVSFQFREWIKGNWGTNSFYRGSLFAREGDPRTRVLAFEKLFSKRRTLSETELREFRRLLSEQIRATSDDPYVVATSIRALAGLLDYLKTKGLSSQADIAVDGELLVSYMSNGALDLQVRGAAIRANTPEIARNGCLALVKLVNKEALTPILGVFEKTSDSSVFGTAAFCLGQINNAAAMSALVENTRRFPDSESCDAALVNMDNVILETLNHPDSPVVIDAINATEHLWKDGQREKYIPALQGLLANNSLAIRKASCERLIDAASRLPFSQEKQELAFVLENIGQSPELREYGERIRQRMSATVLAPATAPGLVPVPKKD